MTKPVLVFPAGMPRALAYRERASLEGTRIIGSSSLEYDPASKHYPEWVHLPYVTSPDFDTALRQAIADFDIDGIFTPNPVVWEYLNHHLAKRFPGVVLMNASPLADEVAPYRTALQWAASVLEQPMPLATGHLAKPPLSVLEMAALFRHAEVIPGMCDHAKIHALCEIFRHTPAGDIVEIGSWWGKSAFVLARLALRHGIGNLLCVDPWSNEHLIQKDEKGLVDRVPVDADEALTVFQINLLPYAQGKVNYLRVPSVEAAVEYQRNREVTTPAFGRTNYTGRIAILHIDGNHSYENAHADIDAWAGLLLPGGWIIIDDYRWPYGDGPRRAADEFIFTAQSKIECAFFMGGALLIKRKDSD